MQLQELKSNNDNKQYNAETSIHKHIDFQWQKRKIRTF